MGPSRTHDPHILNAYRLHQRRLTHDTISFSFLHFLTKMIHQRYQAFLRTLRRYATLGMLSLAILSVCGAFVTFGGLPGSSLIGTDQLGHRRLTASQIRDLLNKKTLHIPA